MSAYIEMKDVKKEYKVYKRPKGFFQSLKALVVRQYQVVQAVNGVSLSIDKGELVGYIGPNGAGKSTTIKMLSGILVPTSGEITVAGRVPHRDRIDNTMHIGVIFGQRSQLYWDLPMEETFDLYKKIYRIDNAVFKRNVAFYVDLLAMEDFLRTPVRQLSLGQKMRANLAVALLHDPDILYLDEPTIGLDVIAKKRIRTFIKEINREKKTTIILTTHNMDDIDQICERIVMIDTGRIVYDDSIQVFKEQYGGKVVIEAIFSDKEAVIEHEELKLVSDEGARKDFHFDRKKITIKEAVSYLTSNFEITDFSVKEPNIETMVQSIYESMESRIQK